MWHRITATIRRWHEDDAGMMAAAVAYYVALSLLPTLLLLASGLGLFLKWTNSGHEAHDYILTMVREQANPALADSIDHVLTDVEELAIYGGPLGAITLLLAALAIFAQLDRAFDRIYRVNVVAAPHLLAAGLVMVRYRLRAFAMLVGLGLAVISIFCAGLAFSWFQTRAGQHVPKLTQFDWVLELIIESLMNALVFAAVYRFVPKVSVHWRHAFAGGLVAALIWEVGRQLLGTCFIGQRYTSAYGLIGALTGIILWGYYGIAVLLIGAEYSQVTASESGGSRVIHATRSPSTRQVPWLRLLDVVFAVCLLYLASFFILRSTRCRQLPDMPSATSLPRAVVFSSVPRVQDAARMLYAPLIEIMPDDRRYPPGRELTALAETREPTRSNPALFSADSAFP